MGQLQRHSQPDGDHTGRRQEQVKKEPDHLHEGLRPGERPDAGVLSRPVQHGWETGHQSHVLEQSGAPRRTGLFAPHHPAHQRNDIRNARIRSGSKPRKVLGEVRNSFCAQRVGRSPAQPRRLQLLRTAGQRQVDDQTTHLENHRHPHHAASGKGERV